MVVGEDEFVQQTIVGLDNFLHRRGVGDAANHEDIAPGVDGLGFECGEVDELLVFELSKVDGLFDAGGKVAGYLGLIFLAE